MESLCLKSSKACSSAEIVGDNEDLLREILLCVPAKPLVRFKCVSKYWLSFISDPIFCDAHMRRNANSKVSGFFYNSETASDPGLKFVSLCNKEDNPSGSIALRLGVPDVKILQSCNGLLLCSISRRRATATGQYCVFNPTTSQIKQLPFLCALKRSWIYAALAFDPSKSPHYKVVCVNCHPSFNQALIYSSETQKWKTQVSARGSWPAGLDYKRGVYCNGGIHWVSNRDDQLLRYDIDKDCPGLVSHPSGHDLMPDRKLRYFGESRGRLQLIDIYTYILCYRF